MYGSEGHANVWQDDKKRTIDTGKPLVGNLSNNIPWSTKSNALLASKNTPERRNLDGYNAKQRS